MTNNNHLYNTKDARWDTVFGEISFLGKVRRARDEFEGDNFYDVELFLAWMRETYGIDIFTTKNGLTANYKILDEQKYLLFELKFSK